MSIRKNSIVVVLCIILLLCIYGSVVTSTKNQSLFFRGSGIGRSVPPPGCSVPVVSNIAADSAYGTRTEAEVTWDTDIGSNSLCIMAHEDSVGAAWRIFADSTTYTYVSHTIAAYGLLGEHEKYYFKVRSDTVGCSGVYSALDSFWTECLPIMYDYDCYQWIAVLGNRFVVAMATEADVAFRYRKLGDPFWIISACPYSGSYYAGEHYCYPSTVANTTYEWQYQAKDQCGETTIWYDGDDATTATQNKFLDTCP